MRFRAGILSNAISERALRPGEFIYDRQQSGAGSERNQKLIPAEAARAVALCGAFLAGCHLKAEQLDDSSGNFGMSVKNLIRL